MKQLRLGLLLALVLLLGACGESGNASPTDGRVNGFGTKDNHVHSLITQMDTNHNLLLATHYGIFRSTEQGKSWQQVSGAPGQAMKGVMTYSLSASPLNPQRLYVLTYIQTTLNAPADTLGLYTSSDGGIHWQLASTKTSLTSSAGQIYLGIAGNESPSEVYIYLTELGPQGLKVSKDNGQHFTQAGSPLPFGNLLGLLVSPTQPGHLIAYGNNGIATTSDAGEHWQVVPGVQGSIYSMASAGPNGPIYASGEAGIYVSNDQGASFTQVYTQNYFGSLTVSPQDAQTLYGIQAQSVYRSTDGGKSWNALPDLKLNSREMSGAYLSVDPDSASQIYLATSFPVEVYHFANNAWKSLTPPA